MRLTEWSLKTKAEQAKEQARYQTAALQSWEKIALRQLDRADAGQRAALLIALALIAAAFILGMTNHTEAAIAFAAIDIAGLATVFVSGRAAPRRTSIEPPPWQNRADAEAAAPTAIQLPD